MSIASDILFGVSRVLGDDLGATFTRANVRAVLAIAEHAWQYSYNPIFQAMREDQPGRAPAIGDEYKGAFRQLERGQYVLSEKGKTLVAYELRTTSWRDAVLSACKRLTSRSGSATFSRRQLISEELQDIVSVTRSEGATPEQTLSRVLQELRTDGVIAFLGEGTYLLLTNPIDETTVDLPDEIIDAAISKSLMLFKDVDVWEVAAQARQRRGVQRLREFVIRNYNNRCAVCDVSDHRLLVASHISRWSDDTEARGRRSNVICFCTFHDALFEFGYFSLRTATHLSQNVRQVKP